MEVSLGILCCSRKRIEHCMYRWWPEYGLCRFGKRRKAKVREQEGIVERYCFGYTDFRHSRYLAIVHVSTCIANTMVFRTPRAFVVNIEFREKCVSGHGQTAHQQQGTVTCAAVTETEQQLAPFPDGGHPPAAVIFDLDGTLTETELLKVCLSQDEPNTIIWSSLLVQPASLSMTSP